MTLGMCWGVAMDAHFRRVQVDLEATADAIAHLSIHGLRGDTPR